MKRGVKRPVDYREQPRKEAKKSDESPVIKRPRKKPQKNPEQVAIREALRKRKKAEQQKARREKLRADAQQLKLKLQDGLLQKNILDGLVRLAEEGKGYTVVPDAFGIRADDEIGQRNCQEIKDYAADFEPEEWLTINFDGHGKTVRKKTHRYMTRSFLTVEKSPRPLNLGDEPIRVTILERMEGKKPVPQCLIDLGNCWMKYLHDTSAKIEFKMLRSDPGCREQPVHADDSDLTDTSELTDWADLSFSMVVAIEDDDNVTAVKLGRRIATVGVVGKADKVVLPAKTEILKKGDILLMKGDCPHAGCAYDRVNYRLHIATGTYRNYHDGMLIGVLNNVVTDER